MRFLGAGGKLSFCGRRLWTPEQAEGLVGWWDATTLNLSDNATVSKWDDLSASGNDVFNTGGRGDDPVIFKTNILNSLPIVRVQSEAWLETTYVAGSTVAVSRNASSNLIAAVASMRSVPAGRSDIAGVVSGVNTGNYLIGLDFHRTANKHCCIIRRGGNDSPTTPSSSASYSTSEFYVRTSTMDFVSNGRITQYVDGTRDPASPSEHGGTGKSEDTYNEYIKIGGYNTTVGTEETDIAEILILKDNVSLKTRLKVEGYLAHKWGLEDKLPATHPYKENPPYYYDYATDLETGLGSPTFTQNAAGTWIMGEISNQSLVLAFDVIFPTTANLANGCLAEKGGSSLGFWCGLKSGGTYFRVRAGGGGSAPAANIAEVDIYDFPQDGKLHTVVVEIEIDGTMTLRVWIDGEFKGSDTSTATSAAGTGSGVFLSGGANVNITGEPTAAWPGGTAEGEARFYSNTLISS